MQWHHHLLFYDVQPLLKSPGRRLFGGATCILCHLRGETPTGAHRCNQARTSITATASTYQSRSQSFFRLATGLAGQEELRPVSELQAELSSESDSSGRGWTSASACSSPLLRRASLPPAGRQGWRCHFREGWPLRRCPQECPQEYCVLSTLPNYTIVCVAGNIIQLGFGLHRGVVSTVCQVR